MRAICEVVANMISFYKAANLRQPRKEVVIMRKKMIPVVLVLLLVSMLTLTACGGVKATLTGKWKLHSMEADGQTVTAKDLQAFGVSFELTLNEDKTGVISAFGMEATGTWSTTDEKTAIFKAMTDEEDAEEEEYTLVLEGNNLFFEQDGEKIIFSK